MCGIAGIYAYHYAANAVDRAEVRRMRDHMAARGPDAGPRGSLPTVFLAAILAALPLAAQPAAEPQPVYLFAGTSPGVVSVLVQPALRKLYELASRTALVPAHGVVVAASYQGRLRDGSALNRSPLRSAALCRAEFFGAAVDRRAAPAGHLSRWCAGVSRGAQEWLRAAASR